MMASRRMKLVADYLLPRFGNSPFAVVSTAAAVCKAIAAFLCPTKPLLPWCFKCQGDAPGNSPVVPMEQKLENEVWMPPRGGWVKLHVDSAFKAKDCEAAGGAVFRYSTGDNGTIDGQGAMWWRKRNNLKYTRGYLIELMHSDPIFISNVTLLNSPAWNIHPAYGSNTVVQGVTILAPTRRALRTPTGSTLTPARMSGSRTATLSPASARRRARRCRPRTRDRARSPRTRSPSTRYV